MKSQRRLVAVLLAAMIVLACAPFALAADGATITVQHGSTKQFEFYRKHNDNWNTVDTSYSYKDFTSVSTGDERIAKIVEQNGKTQIIGVSMGNTTYTATTADGITFTGIVTVISPKPAEGGGGGGLGGGGGTAPASSYSGAFFFPVGEKSFTVPVPQGAAAGGTWSSSHPNILSIDAKTGKIEAKLPGNVTLTYTFGDADPKETRNIPAYVSGGDYYYEVRLFRGLYTGGTGYNPYMPAQAPGAAFGGSDGVYGRVYITVTAGKTNDITFSAEGDITIDPKTGTFEKYGDPTGYNQYTGRYEWTGIIIMNSPTMGVKHEHVVLF